MCEELYQAGVIDGLGRLGLARHITLPTIIPTIVLLWIMNVGNILSAGFDQHLIIGNTITQRCYRYLFLPLWRAAGLLFHGHGGFVHESAGGLCAGAGHQLHRAPGERCRAVLGGTAMRKVYYIKQTPRRISPTSSSSICPCAPFSRKPCARPRRSWWSCPSSSSIPSSSAILWAASRSAQ